MNCSSTGPGVGVVVGSVEVQAELQEKDEYLDVLMTERNLLQDQCSQLQIDLDRHVAVLTERDEALARTAKGLEQSVAVVRQHEDDKAELMQNVTVCQEKLKEAPASSQPSIPVLLDAFDRSG